MYNKGDKVFWHKKGLDRPIIATVGSEKPNEEGKIRIDYRTFQQENDSSGMLKASPAEAFEFVKPEELKLRD